MYSKPEHTREFYSTTGIQQSMLRAWETHSGKLTVYKHGSDGNQTTGARAVESTMRFTKLTYFRRRGKITLLDSTRKS